MHRHEQTFVHAPPATVLARLPRQLAVGGARVELDDGWRSDGAATTRRTGASWRQGRWHGEGTVEVRPAGWGWSELELRWEGTGPPPGSCRRDAGRSGASLTAARALAAHVERRARAPRPPRRSRRPRRPNPTLVAVASLALLVGALGLWTAGSPTPVTADDALASYRTERPASTAADATGTDDPDPATGTDQTPAAAGTTDGPAPTDTSGRTDEAPGDAPSEPTAPAAGDADATGAAAPAGSPPEEEVTSVATDTTRPPAGVYRYATDGWEELDTRGSHRRFPEETVQVVHHTSCGFRQVWEPIEERRDEHAFCGDVDPPLLVTTATSRSFFGQRREQTFACSPVRTAADGWTARCDDTEDGTSMTVTTRRAGTELRRVGGRDVEVTRLRVDAELTGETAGRRRSTAWVRSTDGLLIRSEVQAEIDVPGPFGRMRYREEYVLDLLDLAPRT